MLLDAFAIFAHSIERTLCAKSPNILKHKIAEQMTCMELAMCLLCTNKYTDGVKFKHCTN